MQKTIFLRNEIEMDFFPFPLYLSNKYNETFLLLHIQRDDNPDRFQQADNFIVSTKISDVCIDARYDE